MIPRRAGSGHCSGSRVSSRFQWGRAVLFPFAATLAAELVIVAILVFSGIVELVGAFAMRHNGRLTWHVLFGLAALAAGAILLAWPLQAIVTLPIVLAVKRGENDKAGLWAQQGTCLTA